MSNLSLGKIKNMLTAHNDGIYLLSARENIPDIVDFLLSEIAIYSERLHTTATPEGTEDEIDRLQFEVEMLTLDKKRFSTGLHDLKCAVREAMTRIEAEKFDLSKAASSHEVLYTRCAQRDLDILKDCCGELV